MVVVAAAGSRKFCKSNARNNGSLKDPKRRRQTNKNGSRKEMRIDGNCNEEWNRATKKWNEEKVKLEYLEMKEILCRTNDRSRLP